MASSSRGRPETAIGAFVLGDVNALTEREVQGEVMRVSPTKRRASAIGDHETALKLPAWKLLKVDTGPSDEAPQRGGEGGPPLKGASGASAPSAVEKLSAQVQQLRSDDHQQRAMIEQQRAIVEQQRAIVEQQRAMIEQLQARFSNFEFEYAGLLRFDMMVDVRNLLVKFQERYTTLLEWRKEIVTIQEAFGSATDDIEQGRLRVKLEGVKNKLEQESIFPDRELVEQFVVAAAQYQGTNVLVHGNISDLEAKLLRRNPDAKYTFPEAMTAPQGRDIGDLLLFMVQKLQSPAAPAPVHAGRRPSRLGGPGPPADATDC